MPAVAPATTNVADIQMAPMRIHTDKYFFRVPMRVAAGSPTSSVGSDRRSAADAFSISATARAS